MEQKKPVFARRIFWDVDYDKIDWNAKASFVIVRVFERGMEADELTCRQYYGDDKVVIALLKARYLMPHIREYVSELFNQPIENFRSECLRKLFNFADPYSNK